jgi:hypothetical protein
MDDFIEIFRSGEQTDSQGNTRLWTEDDLDQVVANHADERFGSAPIVVGHPKTDDPAYGWTSELKKVGNTLLAKFKEINPAFEKLVREGAFKKRSVRLIEGEHGWTLAHIGFLGAAAPAVEGLKPINFNTNIVYSDFEVVMEEKTDYQADNPQVDFTIEYAKAHARIRELEFELAKEVKQRQHASMKAKVDQWVATGKLLPAQVVGLTDFMLSLTDSSFEFTTGDHIKRMEPVQWFSDFVNSLPTQIQTVTVDATPPVDPPDPDPVALALKISDYVIEQKAKGRIVGYPQALHAVTQGGVK